MSKAGFLLCALVLWLLPACGGEARPQKEPVRSRYVAGQVWSYATRPGEERSRVHIVRVENHPRFGVMVHVYVDGLKIPNPTAEGEDDRHIEVIQHMPLTEKAVDASVEELVRENEPLPPFDRGYNAWKKAFLAGEGAIFEQTIAESIEHMAKVTEASTGSPYIK